MAPDRRRRGLFSAHVINYADDFVILSRGRAAEALAWTERGDDQARARRINRGKTRCATPAERFDFLGYSFGPHCFRPTGRMFMGASPSKKSVQRFKTKIGNYLVPANTAPWPEVLDRLNSMLRGWTNYFCYGICRRQQRGVDRYVYERVRDFLVRRHKVAGRGTRRFSCEAVYGMGHLRLERLPLHAPPCASR